MNEIEVPEQDAPTYVGTSLSPAGATWCNHGTVTNRGPRSLWRTELLLFSHPSTSQVLKGTVHQLPEIPTDFLRLPMDDDGCGWQGFRLLPK